MLTLTKTLPPDGYVDGLGEVVAACEMEPLGLHIGFQFGHQRRAQLATNGKTLIGRPTADGPFDHEQRADAAHILPWNWAAERNRQRNGA